MASFDIWHPYLVINAGDTKNKGKKISRQDRTRSDHLSPLGLLRQGGREQKCTFPQSAITRQLLVSIPFKQRHIHVKSNVCPPKSEGFISYKKKIQELTQHSGTYMYVFVWLHSFQHDPPVRRWNRRTR